MGKTLFTRIFLTTVLIIFVSCGLTISLLYSQLGSYLVNAQSKTLERTADHMAEVAGRFVGESEGGFITGSYDSAAVWMFQKNIENQSNNNGCTVLIVDVNANIIAMAGDIDFIEDKYIDDYRLDPRLISKALDGSETSGISGDKTPGISKNIYVVTEPIYGGYASENMIWGAVVVCKPLPEIRQARNEVMALVLTSQCIAILIAFLVSFILARSISRPMSKLSSAVKAVASGDYTQKIEYGSNDEMGELISGFNYMTETLKEIDEIRSSFVSNVAHELRTPMTIISGFVEGILDGTISEEDRDKYLGIVLSESRRLGRLVNDLLQASRLESGTAKLVMRQIDVNEMLRKGIISYENAITEKNIHVEVQFKYDHCYALGDEDSIYRVIMNLLDNAVKFTPEDGVIRVRSSEGVRKIEVSIENTGSGISEKDLSKIWERFYKTDRSRSIDKRGVGLGLYLVKTIISQHNNRIWAESKEGEYTRFTFTLDRFNVKKTEQIT